jgi:hypothetical protein
MKKWENVDLGRTAAHIQTAIWAVDQAMASGDRELNEIALVSLDKAKSLLVSIDLRQGDENLIWWSAVPGLNKKMKKKAKKRTKSRG